MTTNMSSSQQQGHCHHNPSACLSSVYVSRLVGWSVGRAAGEEGNHLRSGVFASRSEMEETFRNYLQYNSKNNKNCNNNNKNCNNNKNSE